MFFSDFVCLTQSSACPCFPAWQLWTYAASCRVFQPVRFPVWKVCKMTALACRLVLIRARSPCLLRCILSCEPLWPLPMPLSWILLVNCCFLVMLMSVFWSIIAKRCRMCTLGAHKDSSLGPSVRTTWDHQVPLVNGYVWISYSGTFQIWRILEVHNVPVCSSLTVTFMHSDAQFHSFALRNLVSI